MPDLIDEKPFSEDEFNSVREVGIALFSSPENMFEGAQIIRMCKELLRLKKLQGEEVWEIRL